MDRRKALIISAVTAVGLVSYAVYLARRRNRGEDVEEGEGVDDEQVPHNDKGVIAAMYRLGDHLAATL